MYKTKGVMCEGSTERTNGVEEGEEGVLRERERMGSKWANERKIFFKLNISFFKTDIV